MYVELLKLIEVCKWNGGIDIFGVAICASGDG